MTTPPRVHIVAGGFPLGAHGGHDHDYARLRILEMLEKKDIKSSVSSDYNDVDRFLPISRLLITYTAGPVLNDAQAGYVDDWLKAGGRWLGLHGTSGGKAARAEGTNRRRMVRMKHHEVLGGFFINHPPVRRFNVDVAEQRTSITNNLPESFEVIDEPYSAGRKLEFVVQEMGRKTNTIGSKANDTEISRSVVEMKGTLEKIRELIQNVE